jgi:arginase
MNSQTLLTPYYLNAHLPGLETLTWPGWVTNSPQLPPGDEQDQMSALHRPLANWIAKTAQQDRIPVSIAGDCCTAIPVLAGLQRAGINPTLIWFDAHGDFNTWETTPSGFLGGMPLAMIVGRGEQRMCKAVGLHPMPENQIILTDARDLDPGENDAVADSKMTQLLDVRDLLTYPLTDRPLWVHFDTDVIRPEDAPAMNYPTQGGPSAHTLQEVFHQLAETGRVIAVSVSAWNPGCMYGVVRNAIRIILKFKRLMPHDHTFDKADS